MEEKEITENVESTEEKKDVPEHICPKDFVPEGKVERTLFMIMRIVRVILRFFERRMINSRQRRLARRMNEKK